MPEMQEQFPVSNFSLRRQSKPFELNVSKRPFLRILRSRD